MTNDNLPELDPVDESISQELERLLNDSPESIGTSAARSSKKLLEAEGLESIHSSIEKVTAVTEDKISTIEKAVEVAETISVKKTVVLEKTVFSKTGCISALISLPIIAIGILLFYFYGKDKITYITEDPYHYELPATGKLTSITEIETFWLKPTPEHKVSRRLALVPATTLTLSDNTTGDAEIRIVFYSDQENTLDSGLLSKGDSRTLTIKNGLFQNGKKTISVHATDGIEDVAFLRYYTVQDEKRWTVEISEGSPQSTFDAFSPILVAPIQSIIDTL